MEFYENAIDMSLRSSHRYNKHGAILVKGNEIVGVGFNNEHYHAEAKAISQCVQCVLQVSPKVVQQIQSNSCL